MTPLFDIFLFGTKDAEFIGRQTRQTTPNGGSGRQHGASLPTAPSKTKKEGSLEFLIEVTDDNKVRVRARRCNYAPGVILKEMTEETILARLKKDVTYWNEQGNKATY
jgi:hypothetical protein